MYISLNLYTRVKHTYIEYIHKYTYTTFPWTHLITLHKVAFGSWWQISLILLRAAWAQDLDIFVHAMAHTRTHNSIVFWYCRHVSTYWGLLWKHLETKMLRSCPISSLVIPYPASKCWQQWLANPITPASFWLTFKTPSSYQFMFAVVFRFLFGGGWAKPAWITSASKFSTKNLSDS